MPVPNYQPAPSTSQGNEFPIEQTKIFAFGSKEAWYTFVGEQDAMEGVGPNAVAAGDEQWQSDYDAGWKMGNYFRTMSGVNGFTI
jgi:hypothetical protein